MTRSIFDPNSGETERSGSRNLPADAEQISQMPPDIISGDVDEDEDDAVVDLSPDEVAQLQTPAPSAAKKSLDPPAKS
jgi:hypothetical protein